MTSRSSIIPPSISRPHRKPLQPKNFPANLAALAGAAINPKKPNLTIEEPAGKENSEISSWGEEMKPFSEDSSLGEELEAARLRTERLRRERERGEEKMREMDTAFERWMREAESRLEELAVAEMEIRRVVRAKERRASCVGLSPFASLRAREEKKRWQAAQLQEIGNAAGKRKSEPSSGSKRNE